MVFERIERVFRGRQHLDVETLEQGAGAERVRRQGRLDGVKVEVRGLRRQPLLEVEDLGEHPFQPEPRRGPAKQVIAIGELPPDRPRVGFVRPAVQRPDPQIFQRHPGAVQHAKDVVVRRDQQVGRVGEGRVLREPGRVAVAVRADDRKVGDSPVKLPREDADRMIGGEQAVGMKAQVQHEGPLGPSS